MVGFGEKLLGNKITMLKSENSLYLGKLSASGCFQF